MPDPTTGHLAGRGAVGQKDKNGDRGKGATVTGVGVRVGERNEGGARPVQLL